MKKKTKLSIIFVLILAVVIGAFAGLIIKRNNAHKLGYLILTQGPWGSDNMWVSDDGSSYLQCSKEPDVMFATVTAYFTVNGQEQSYQLNCIDHLAYLDKIENGVIGETKEGRIKFDGSEFILCGLDKDTFGNDEFHYFISDENSSR